MEAQTSAHRKLTNKLLSELSTADRELVQPYLQPVILPVRMVLEHWGRPIEHIYFLDSGLASVVTGKKVEVEVGLVGYDGLTGVSAILGDTDPAINQTYMQIGGSGRRISVIAIRHCMESSPTLHKALLRFVNAFVVQLSRTAMANAKGLLNERLARWLLMAQDRMQSNSVPLTHEFLALMLGVRRSGVSVALEGLASDGLVHSSRGQVTIVDREALIELAGPFYTPPNEEHWSRRANQRKESPRTEPGLASGPQFEADQFASRQSAYEAMQPRPRLWGECGFSGNRQGGKGSPLGSAGSPFSFARQRGHDDFKGRTPRMH